jgi:micrococcal nuclease
MRYRLIAILALCALLTAPRPARAEGPYRAYLPLAGATFFERPVTWATVTKIIDGDTVWVDLNGDGTGDNKVRYIGIDTPETTFGKHDCYGAEATERNRALCAGQRVALEKDVSEVDRYDRLLRYVYLADGTWINGVLVREGYARVTIYPPDRHYEAALFALQDTARAQGVGGWGACGW